LQNASYADQLARYYIQYPIYFLLILDVLQTQLSYKIFLTFTQVTKYFFHALRFYFYSIYIHSYYPVSFIITFSFYANDKIMILYMFLSMF